MRTDAIRALGLCLALTTLVGCSKHLPTDGMMTGTADDSSSGSAASLREPSEVSSMIIDAVRKRKDPRSGWFGPSLRYAYLHNKSADDPTIFCGEGVSLPTGKLITVFVRERPSTPDSTACMLVVDVVEGEGVWYKGKPMTRSAFDHLPENVKLVAYDASSANTLMGTAWSDATPIGEPCTNLPTSWYKLVDSYKGKSCSIIVQMTETSRAGPAGTNDMYTVTQTHYYFVNWKVPGYNHQGYEGESGAQVAEALATKFGMRYLVKK